MLYNTSEFHALKVHYDWFTFTWAMTQDVDLGTFSLAVNCLPRTAFLYTRASPTPQFTVTLNCADTTVWEAAL